MVGTDEEEMYGLYLCFFQIEIHQTCSYGFLTGDIIICTFFHFIGMKETKIIALIEMKGTRIIVCIHYQETSTSLIVFMTEPIFDELHQLTTYIHPLKFLIYTNSSD